MSITAFRYRICHAVTGLFAATSTSLFMVPAFAEHAIPPTDEPISINFDYATFENVFATIADFTETEIDTKSLPDLEITMKVLDISIELLMTSLLDCYGLISSETVSGYKITKSTKGADNPDECFAKATSLYAITEQHQRGY